ncbi:vacuolar protein sorting-associated protein [Anaeramoeba flamelloides]|uniref:Vacuolar protein sorting-associated protein n=1 Tax=Anaeramoeba flamelloides TaxID=1746091 RepID=A0AAV7Z8I2_9EUKA|nr:vacuolar protein sorting-associated protein [Anaeramoeba flamelloides]KAJ6225961.1 vacuolar protein sorting-associated protein [Anaeramoeba flamelloides]
MNVYESIKHYINNMTECVMGPKVLLLDKETTTMISLVFSQSELLEKEIFLIEKLNKTTRKEMLHLKAIVFVRPIEENFESLGVELTKPKYSDYYLFFSNTLYETYLTGLAKSDKLGVVRQVHEFYADYYVINKDLFEFSMPNISNLIEPKWDTQLFDRITSGLISVCLSLKKKPIIRYQADMPLTERIAKKVKKVINQEKELFYYRRQETEPLLLIIDRRSDPLTPLLNQWTYQSMVHEYFGIENNLVYIGTNIGDDDEEEEEESEEDFEIEMENENEKGKQSGVIQLKKIENKKKKPKKNALKTGKGATVLSQSQDQFFAETMFSDFGDLGDKLTKLVQQFSTRTKVNQNIRSIDEMKKFIANYPEFKKLSGSVSKHVAIVDQISKIIRKRSIFVVSELEQSLAVNETHKKHLQEILECIQNTKITVTDCLRLACLYALRYEKHSSNSINEIKEALVNRGISNSKIKIVDRIIKYAGIEKRGKGEDLFNNKNIFSSASRVIKRSLKDVDNVYIQHVPLIHQLIERVAKSKLNSNYYPNVGNINLVGQISNLIIFVVGGVTYEEAKFVDSYNKQQTGLNVIIGGTSMLNTKSFFSHVKQCLGSKNY